MGSTIHKKLLPGLLTFVVSCGTWLGNPKDPEKTQPQGNSNVTILFHGAGGVLALAPTKVTVIGKSGSSIGTLALTQAQIVLKEIRLDTDDSDVEEKQEFEGPFIVDLLNDRMRPDPGAISINAGTYRRIRMKLAKLNKDATVEGDPMIGRSVSVQGTFTPADGSASQIFALTLDLDEEFRIGKSGGTGIPVIEGLTNPVVVAFNLSTWLNFTGAHADLSDLPVGPIILDKNADEMADEVRDSIKELIKRSAEFGKDDDQDGELDEDEKDG